ncbi:hypothetical protein [Stenoxybacter acetivorans]|uniref:hypothetical protein n=1 Tax=Stenoxybacter acetivorans TaxID=422441 RepID=UPI00055C5F97|nr:hypothetical protein [Stenoxybacter acetivorans]
MNIVYEKIYNGKVPNWLIIGMNRALLDMIYPEIAVILVQFQQQTKNVQIITYLSRKVIDEDFINLNLIALRLKELMENYFNLIEIECKQIHKDQVINNLSSCAVFWRSEWY